jgi:neurotrimin
MMLFNYRAESITSTPSYKTHMRLFIYNIQASDFGTYKCVAKNPRGETDGTIRLYGKFFFLLLCIV